MRAPLRRNANKVPCHFSASLLISMVSITTSLAEVKYDGSFGRSDVATSTFQAGKTRFEIRAEDGFYNPNNPNLFHSFEKFDLSNSEAAVFLGPSNVRNILARITGGSASSIDGKITSAISGANLFLMNPKGILFGPNASVDVSGSFFATTADYIKLGNDGKFAATKNAADSVLTVSDPSAFGFLTPNPAAIHVDRSKFSSPGGTLGFVGGDVTISGDSALEGADVQIVSVRSAGEAALQMPDAANGLRYPSLAADNFTEMGDIAIGDPTPPEESPPPRATIMANRIAIRGGTFVMKNAEVTAIATEPGDGVTVRATREFIVGDESMLQSFNDGDFRNQATIDISAGSGVIAASSQILTLAIDPGAGGDLRMAIDGSLSLVDSASIFTITGSPDRGGDIRISAGSLSLENSFIQSQSEDASYPSGHIYLDIAGLLSLSQESSIAMAIRQAHDEKIVVMAQDIAILGPQANILFTDTSSDGVGGLISVTASRNLSILDGGLVSAATFGRDGATVDVSAGNLLISSLGRYTQPTGITARNASGPGSRGGDVRVRVAASLNVLDGGVISSHTVGQGAGGNIAITARDATVTGPSGIVPTVADSRFGITAQNVIPNAGARSGDSGSVRLTLSGRLEVRDSGAIMVDTIADGDGGDIQISANEVEISSRGIVAARTLHATRGGKGGDVSINAASSLGVTAGGRISAETAGSGAAGTISIRGGDVEVEGQEARITAVSGSPTITATGSGGDLHFDVRRLRISDGGQLTASTFGPGAGGNIDVKAEAITVSGSNPSAPTGIAAQTLSPGAGGAGGTVQIDTRTLIMTGSGATISTQTLGAGNGGAIQIDTGTLSMSNQSSVKSSSSGTGAAGSIFIDAESLVSLRGGSTLSVASVQSDAGDIRLRSGTTISLTDSSITAQAGANGGNIDLRATQMFSLTESQLTAAAGINGGNIFIDPIFVVLNDSLISANAIRGRGGNIRIISDYFLASRSFVTATSELGIDGTVQIDALNNDLNSSLVEMPSALLNAESLLRELCTVKIDDFSSFISEGRGGMPPLPGEALPSLMIVQ